MKPLSLLRMSLNNKSVIRIKNAKTNNLKEVSLEIPHQQLIVITGVSGSGKSSFAFDVIAKEGQRRYFETLPSFARQYMGKISPANVDLIEGLSPVITVQQKTTGMTARSTVGTLSDLYSWLRLLFARSGQLIGDKSLWSTSSSTASQTTPISDQNIKPTLTRSLFSFNSDQGKCLRCNGLGNEEKIDLEKLIIYPEKTIREGALAPTLPTGYIMYSQVTIEVLNQVCQAEGFDVDIVWNDLAPTQQNIILYGSNKIKVPFGKHSLESRLKWTGIKAKPREEGYYKGMIPIMSDILKRDRNANILKYVSAVVCNECNGKRLNQKALSIGVKNKTIADLLELSLIQLLTWLNNQKWDEIGTAIIEKICPKIDLLINIGLGHLGLNQPAKTLSESEVQRIRVVNQIGAELSEVLYVFDEPSIGLFGSENKTMINMLRSLVNKGNTVIVVEHDIETIKSADWIVDIGPYAGTHGGEILFNGKLNDFLTDESLAKISPTRRALDSNIGFNYKTKEKTIDKYESIELKGCHEGVLSGDTYRFVLGKLNVIYGKSGSGKRDLIRNTLKPLIENQISGKSQPVKVDSYSQIDRIKRLVFVDQSPIGRTPRSNPATYLKLSDHIRDIYAKLPESKAKGLTKSHFSFNTKGGRCETCQGAGKTQIGMHFLGKVDLICETCQGKRFNAESLSVFYKNKPISAIYGLTVNEAFTFFESDKKLHQGLGILQKIGLGYLTLGQASTTLSGGEAQRIKLANELQKKSNGNSLYMLDEPSIGLHPYDLTNLLHVFDELTAAGNTLVCIEQDDIIRNHADHIIKLEISERPIYTDATESELHQNIAASHQETKTLASTMNSCIKLNGVSTHLLKNIDVTFPKRQLSVVTGLSGSGKSSLVYDSLFAEASSRFSESLSTFNRSLFQSQNKAIIESATGLTPTIAIQRKRANFTNRSTVGTLTGIYDHFRLLFSRIAQLNGYDYTAQHFSFNHKLGACPQCKGYGFEKKCDPDLIIIDPNESILSGALNQSKAAKYFTNLEGQFVAIIKKIAQEKKWDLTQSWKSLSAEIQTIILYGTGDTEWQLDWEFKTKTRAGTQALKTKWMGFCHYIDDEYERRVNNKNIDTLLAMLHNIPCSSCSGKRLKPDFLATTFNGKNIAELSQLRVNECLDFLQIKQTKKQLEAILELVYPPVKRLLETIINLGLGYLSLNRLAGSLSGGETQRIRLAGQLSANLYGVTYVLDEPTIGLDKTQINVLIQLFNDLIQKGNTVIVVEHDKNLIAKADYLVELGPYSGNKGGELSYQGSLKNLKKYPDTHTYDLLFKPTLFERSKALGITEKFGVRAAHKNNLKEIDVTFQSNRITALTGVSGSGKSTLIKGVLYDSVLKKRAIECDSLFGMAIFDAVYLIDQKPVALNALSSPASYLSILGQLQRLFAKSSDAKSKMLKRGDFSYQSKTGKCENCNGYGETKTSMDFMSDIWIPCEVCQGNRYNHLIESIKIKSHEGKAYAIGEVLQLTINKAVNLFNDSKLNQTLQTLVDLGIGHLKLGQAGNTLSGGEAQRLKLAKIIIETTGKNLYLFDEPSTGLHQQDLIKLIHVIQNLVNKGHTVIFIEHNAHLISIAHHEIKLGPGSGAAGGTLI